MKEVIRFEDNNGILHDTDIECYYADAQILLEDTISECECVGDFDREALICKIKTNEALLHAINDLHEGHKKGYI